MPCLLTLLSSLALADVVVPPPDDSRYVSHVLRLDGLQAHPGFVFLVYDDGPEISGWRAFSAGGQAEWELMRGGSRLGAAMSQPAVRMLSAAAYESWAAATNAEKERQRAACSERGEGCMHISRFVPRVAPPSGAIDCGLRLSMEATGPADGPEQIVHIATVTAATETSCVVTLTGRETSGAPTPASTPPAQVPATTAPETRPRCATGTGAGSLLLGLVLALGLVSRRR